MFLLIMTDSGVSPLSPDLTLRNGWNSLKSIFSPSWPLRAPLPNQLTSLMPQYPFPIKAWRSLPLLPLVFKGEWILSVSCHSAGSKWLSLRCRLPNGAKIQECWPTCLQEVGNGWWGGVSPLSGSQPSDGVSICEVQRLSNGARGLIW